MATEVTLSEGPGFMRRPLLPRRGSDACHRWKKPRLSYSKWRWLLHGEALPLQDLHGTSPSSEAQPVSTGLHLTIEQQQEVPQGPMSPKGTAPYEPIQSLFHFQDQPTPLTGFPPTGQLSFERTTSPQQADQPAISPSTSSPPQQRQHLPGTQEKGGRRDLRRRNHGSAEHYGYQKSHKFVVLVVVMVPSVGMACITHPAAL